MEDGDRITDAEKQLLEVAGITITNADAMPDVLLWNPKTNAIWIIEAVTSDGEVDDHKVAQVKLLAGRSGIVDVGFTTTYRT